MEIANDDSTIFPRFVAVDAFFPSAFLLFCHSENNATVLNLLSLFNSILNGVSVCAGDTALLAKSRKDVRGEFLFGPAIVGALSRTQTLAHRTDATVLVPRRDEKPPCPEYRDLFRFLYKAKRYFFSASMTTCIADIKVKLPVIVNGVVSQAIDKFLSDLLLPRVYDEIKSKRGENI